MAYGIYPSIIGLLVTLLGLFLWGMGFLNLGKKAFSILPEAKVLQTERIYKYFRHPIYLGITLTFLGLSLSLGSWEGFIYIIIIIIPLTIIRAREEEKVLMAKFGQEYLDYKKRVKL